ncbi:rSAM-modified peptide [Flavobacterium sp. 3-210]
MKSTKMKIEDFETLKLSSNQQKAVRGGDGETDSKNDPGKTSNGNG